eukprot:3205282-Karenia_brevis.AAC.1
MGRNCPSKGLGKGAAPQFGKGGGNPQLGDKGKGKGAGAPTQLSKGVPGKGTPVGKGAPAGKGQTPQFGSQFGKGVPGATKGLGKGGFTFQG